VRNETTGQALARGRALYRRQYASGISGDSAGEPPRSEKENRDGSGKLIAATKRDALAARRKKLTTLGALIRRRLTTVVESFYDIGVALTEVLKSKLYAAGTRASKRGWRPRGCCRTRRRRSSSPS